MDKQRFPKGSGKIGGGYRGPNARGGKNHGGGGKPLPEQKRGRGGGGTQGGGGRGRGGGGGPEGDHGEGRGRGRGGRGRGRGRGEAQTQPQPPKPAVGGSLGRKGAANGLDYDADDVSGRDPAPVLDHWDELEEEEPEPAAKSKPVAKFTDKSTRGAAAQTPAANESTFSNAGPGGGSGGRTKVEMQIIHMSSDAQARVEKTLQELYGGKYKMRDARSYRDAGGRLDRRFWVRDRQLLVRGVETGAVGDDSGPSPGDLPDGVDAFKVTKLEEFGFHRSRCIKTVQECEGDVGMALEQLLGEFLKVPTENPEEVDEDEAKMFDEMKEDEKTALQSIYEENFVERVPGRVWEIRLKNLQGTKPYLRKDERPKPKVPKADEKNVCKFFLRGHCKFGRKCRQKHIQPEKAQVVDDKHLRRPKEENLAFLEVRFPSSGCNYPKDPPVVGFSTTVSEFPRSACLNVTRRLAEEARMLAADHAPSVFAMVSLLENKATIADAIKEEVSAFSYDEELVPKSAQVAGDVADSSAADVDAASRLVAGLTVDNGGGGGNDAEDETEGQMASRIRAEERSRQMDKMLEENAKLRSRFQQRTVNESMQEFKRNLPAWDSRIRILETLKLSQVRVGLR